MDLCFHLIIQPFNHIGFYALIKCDYNIRECSTCTRAQNFCPAGIIFVCLFEFRTAWLNCWCSSSHATSHFETSHQQLVHLWVGCLRECEVVGSPVCTAMVWAGWLNGAGSVHDSNSKWFSCNSIEHTHSTTIYSLARQLNNHVPLTECYDESRLAPSTFNR